jgi:hypothetical protein
VGFVDIIGIAVLRVHYQTPVACGFVRTHLIVEHKRSLHVHPDSLLSVCHCTSPPTAQLTHKLAMPTTRPDERRFSPKLLGWYWLVCYVQILEIGGPSCTRRLAELWLIWHSVVVKEWRLFKLEWIGRSGFESGEFCVEAARAWIRGTKALRRS